MKKTFITPDLKLSKFKVENIITDSGVVSVDDKISALKAEALENKYMQNAEATNVLTFTL